MKRTIQLGTSKFELLELTFRQLRIVTPLIVKIRAATKGLTKDELATKGLSEEVLTDIGEVVFQGIARSYPHIDRERFLDMQFSIPDLLAAYPTVCLQSGGEIKEAETEGEASGAAAAPATLPTGTPTTTI